MKKSFKQIGNVSLVAFGTAMLVACSGHGSNTSGQANQVNSEQDSLVECYGVAQNGTPLMMTRQMCDKLPSTKQVPVNTSDYVQCYGVAAAGKNDCATKASSCAGSAKVAHASDAWVSLPQGVCENLKGAVVGKSIENK